MTDFSTSSPATRDAQQPDGQAAASHEPVQTGDGVIEALRRQVILYEQIEKLALEQSELVANGQTEQLLTLLAQRQRLIAGLTGINDQLEPVRVQWASFVGTLTGVQKQSVASLTNRIDSLRQSILEQDDQDRATLSAARDNVGRELRKLSQTGQAARAYQSGRMGSSESNAMAASTVSGNNESPSGVPGGPKGLPAQSRFTDRKG